MFPGFTSEGHRPSFVHPASNRMKKQKTVLLIDGDVFVYQIGLAAEKPINWGDDLWTLHADFAECRETLAAKVAALVETLEADEVRFALSCPTESGFRRDVCATYKSNRKDVRKPIVHGPLRDLLLSDYDTILREKLEADDVLGILATQPTSERRIIVSVDKDFRGVPCSLYRTSDAAPTVETISAQEAQRFHALQCLTGDRTDGYVGIPGCGPATAAKMLEGVATADLWPTIAGAYEKAGLSTDLALTNARLARILQWGDYNTKTGAIKLWTPPSNSPKTSPATNSSQTKSSEPTTSSPRPTAFTNGRRTCTPPAVSATTEGTGESTASIA